MMTSLPASDLIVSILLQVRRFMPTQTLPEEWTCRSVNNRASGPIKRPGCGVSQCKSRPMLLSLREYEELRAEPDRFAVLPGHEEVDVEEVVERREGYLVVRKFSGGPAELAAARDPRS